MGFHDPGRARVKLTIINYGSGNLHSIAKAFERAVAETGWGGRILVSDDPADVRDAERIVLPGVGSFGDCARGLQAVQGMRDALEYAIREKKRPFLGICVGMQLLAARGLEHGAHQGLGWIGGEVCALAPVNPDLKIPHMGWNQNQLTQYGRTHSVLQGMDGRDCYFVHSYHFVADDKRDVLATCDYGGPIAAAIGRENILGVQFHPEKSQAQGLQFLGQFLNWQV